MGSSCFNFSILDAELFRLDGDFPLGDLKGIIDNVASNSLGLTLAGYGILADVFAAQFFDAVDVLGFQDDWSSDPIRGGEDLGGDHIEAVKGVSGELTSISCVAMILEWE